MEPRLKQNLKVLDLRRDAELDKIRRAYRRKAFQYHPDRNKSPHPSQEFILISRVYEFLIANYDRLNTTEEEANMVKAEADQYQEYERSSERSMQEEMERARRSYNNFRRKNLNYRQSWFFIPVKILAYLIFLSIIAVGLALIIGPLIILIYNGNWTLIILYVPLAIWELWTLISPRCTRSELIPIFIDEVMSGNYKVVGL